MEGFVVAGTGGISLVDGATGVTVWNAVLHEQDGFGAARCRWIRWYGDGVADEAKPVPGTTRVLATTVAGLVALVDTAGEAPELLAWEPGAHSAALLPDGLVAVAVSSSPGAYPEDAPRGTPSRVVLHRRGGAGAALDQLPLADAHGVCWDPRAGVLWALGWDRVVACAIDGGRLALRTTHLLPAGATTGANHGGHDLVAAGDGALLVTTVTGAWRFADGVFTALPGLAGRHLKSIAAHPRDGRLAWVEADPRAPAIGRDIALGDGRRLVPRLPPYKARWVERDGDGRFA